ncbi:eCIS core domain-containing protein [Pseudomonas sp. NFX1]|uniref:eCIS core domain-containing protein n=1 Tax=Pseudomonas sp. NFX1 TaxID=2201355 RepID=UPI003DA77B71
MKPVDLLLGLFLSAPVLAEQACPPGQYQVCLMGCFCAPVDPGQAGQILKDVEAMASTSLAYALRQARDEANASGSEPMPLHIHAQLEAWYDFAVLDAVRFRVGDEQQMSAANAMLQNPDVNAVTLIDTIIFRHASDAEDNVALWAHELKHVQQYQVLGVEEFARRYTRDFNELEGPAYKIEAEVAKALRERSSGQAR